MYKKEANLNKNINELIIVEIIESNTYVYWFQQPSEEVCQTKMVNYRVGSRARSQGGPIRRPHDRKLDTSPYSSGTFLSPPPDTSWRRTNSDSALHQSTMQVEKLYVI